MTSKLSQPTNVGSNDQLGLVPERAKVGDAPLCDQMQTLQARAMKLHPIDLHDPQLDTADPYTRLFLLAEYWQRQANEARACLDDECDRTDSLLTIFGLEVDRCRSEGGSLMPHKVLALLGDVKAAAAPELAHLRADLDDYLRHVIDMAKGEPYLDVVRGNAEALLMRIDSVLGPNV